ncbi:MAG: CAP domain-containing protein [Propionibacteriaceae bacterium]|jgi:uncharacterized protein YkwD|nr:CAP domain-containing protein [Propionibacteriaceae bacterium]
MFRKPMLLTLTLAVVLGLACASAPAANAKTITKIAKPKISDTTPAVGQKLTAKADTATKPKAKIYYQWLRGGKAIKGATKKTYTVKSTDAGKKLAVKACYYKEKYTTRCVTSKATKKVPTPPTAPTTLTVAAPEAVDYAVNALNEVRSEARTCGGTKYPAVPALKVDAKLTKAVQAFTEALAQNKTWGLSYTADGKTYHVADLVDRTKPYHVLTGYGYDASTEEGAKAYVAALLKKSDHCAVIMSAKYTQAAFGGAHNAKSKYPYVETVVLHS